MNVLNSNTHLGVYAVIFNEDTTTPFVKEGVAKALSLSTV